MLKREVHENAHTLGIMTIISQGEQDISEGKLTSHAQVLVEMKELLKQLEKENV